LGDRAVDAPICPHLPPMEDEALRLRNVYDSRHFDISVLSEIVDVKVRTRPRL
jgi:hypothetical protein